MGYFTLKVPKIISYIFSEFHTQIKKIFGEKCFKKKKKLNEKFLVWKNFQYRNNLIR